MTAEHDRGLLHERVIVDRARHGDATAYAELYRRLAPSAWRLALAVTRDPELAAGAASAALAATFAGAPSEVSTASARARVLAAVRHAAADPTLQPLPLDGLRLPRPSPAITAFASLPERWRSALWVLDAEGCARAEAAVALGVPEAAVGPLTARARAGLAEQVIAVKAGAVRAADCRRTADRLVDYAGGRLTERDQARARRHLDGCEACRGILSELDDLTPSLRRLAVPVPLALAGASEARWRAALVRDVGRLHLTLPGGRPVPAWAERTVAGAAAVVIALGIASAVLVAGRGGRVRDDRLARAVPAEALLSGDGESALGGSSGLSGFDILGSGGGAGLPDATSAAAAGGALKAPGAGSGTAPAAGAAVLDSSAVPAGPSKAPATGGAPAPNPTPPPAVEPALEATVAVGGVLGLSVGDRCTGASVAGTTVGCTPATTGAPLELDLGGSLLGG